MAKVRGSYHHGDLRRALLEAAQQLIAARGASEFSLREAARQVRVSPSAAYAHFRDKADLLHALANDGFVKLATAMEAAVARDCGELRGAARASEHMRAVGRAYVRFAVAEPARFRVMFGPYGAGRRSEPAHGVGPSGRDPYGLLVDALKAMKAAGLIRGSVREAAMPAWAAVHGLAALGIDGAWRVAGTDDLDGAIELVVNNVVAGLTSSHASH